MERIIIVTGKRSPVGRARTKATSECHSSDHMTRERREKLIFPDVIINNISTISITAIIIIIIIIIIVVVIIVTIVNRIIMASN